MKIGSKSSGRAILCMSPKPPDPDAIRFAEKIVNAYNMHLVLLHTHRDTAELTEGHQSVEAIQQLLQSPPDEFIEIRGDLETVLADELDPDAHELVILGTSTKTFDRRTTLMSRRLARKIGDSVLVIQQPSPSIERILVCTGGHPASNLVIERGLQLGQALDAEVVILHVVTGAPAMYTGLPAVDEGLEEILSRDTPLATHLRSAAQLAEDMGINARLDLRHGVVVEEILRACEMENIDLVVIGSPEPRSIFERLTLGQVGPQLLTSTKIPLMIARIEPKDS